MSNIFDAEIAACTVEIKKDDGSNSNKGTFANYLKRGTMRCLNQLEKEDGCSSAIEDLSIALHFKSNDTNALYYRACAYFISKDYGSAIDDCNLAIKGKTGSDTAPFHELLGNIYFAQRNYKEAEASYLEAIKELIKVTPMPMLSSSLLENYRKACAKARGN